MLTISGLLSAAILSVSCVGCAGEAVSASSDGLVGARNLSELATPIAIDAGVVFADQSSYMCWPLARFGIATDDRVVSVNTSCECTQASIVDYQLSTNECAQALRVEFVAEPVNAAGSPPAHLAVEVTMLLASGQSKSLTVELLLTSQKRSGGES